MQRGHVLVTTFGSRTLSCFAGGERVHVPWAPAVMAGSVWNGVEITGAEEAVIEPGRTRPVQGRRWSVHEAVLGPDGRVEARMGPDFVAASEGMLRVFHQVATAAECGDPVFIVGESGTGKELVARTLHDLGRGSDAPFIAINLAAVPFDLAESEMFGRVRGAFTGASDSQPGAFEVAGGGTVFLDEVAEATCSVQAKLLRVVETRTVSRIGSPRQVAVGARIMAATNQDPAMAVAAGRLRLDLLERLACLVIRVPPLRERVEDVGVVAGHIARGLPGGALFDAGAVSALEAYNWPGNVRELRNVIRRAHLQSVGGRVTAALVREAMDTCPVSHWCGPEWSSCAIREPAADRFGRARQIAESGLPRSTFYYRLKRGKITTRWTTPFQPRE